MLDRQSAISHDVSTLPISSFPQLPDDDPIQALRLVWRYFEQITQKLAILYLGFIGVFVVAIASIACYLLRWNPTLSWISDFVPLGIAVVGSVMSIKRPPKEHHVATIILLCFAGICGTLTLHLARIAEQKDHKAEVRDLRDRMDTVRTQQVEVLSIVSATKPSTLNAQDVELERRSTIIKTLRGEYILTHEHISPGLLQGTESPPTDWMNKRLSQLGEKWTFTPPQATVSLKTEKVEPTAPPATEIMVAVGDDEGTFVRFDVHRNNIFQDWFELERHCQAPFKCYPERDLQSGTPIDLFVGAKGWARIFFTVYNIGGTSVPHPTIGVLVARGHEVSISRVNARQPYNSGQISVEFTPNETVDVLPFSMSRIGYDYGVDVSVGSVVDKCDLVFRIFSSNLPAKALAIPFRIMR